MNIIKKVFLTKVNSRRLKLSVVIEPSLLGKWRLLFFPFVVLMAEMDICSLKEPGQIKLMDSKHKCFQIL